MDVDLTSVLDNSFDTLEEAFSGESRKVVRQIKCEWQKIVKYRDDILNKEEELISAKNNLMHLNQITSENEKYIKAAQCRIENLKQSNIQLKSKLSLLKKEEERTAKKYKEDTEYMTKKITIYEKKWQERYESSYSKNPKIKEKEQAVRALEETRQKLYTLDDELQKYEKKLFQAKCERNQRATEESKFYPFKSFVVNVAKIYIKTLKESEECQRLMKDIYVIESAKNMKSIRNLESTPSKGTLEALQLQNVQLSEVHDGANAQKSENNEGESKHLDNMQNSRKNVTNSTYRVNLSMEKFQYWKKNEKTKSLSELHNTLSSGNSKINTYQSPIVKRWMEKYKIYTPKFKESTSNQEVKLITQNNKNRENKTCFLQSYVEDKSSAQENHNSSVDSEIKDTKVLKKGTSNKISGAYSKHTMTPVSEENMSIVFSNESNQFANPTMKKLQQNPCAPMDVSIENVMHLSDSIKQPLQEKNASINSKYSTKNHMHSFVKDISSFTVPPNINQVKSAQNVVTPFYQDKSEYMDIDTSVNNSRQLIQNVRPVSPEKNKSTESVRNSLTSILSPFKKVNKSSYFTSADDSTDALKETVPLIEEEAMETGIACDINTTNQEVSNEVNMHSFSSFSEQNQDSNISKKEAQVSPTVFVIPSKQSIAVKNASKYFQNSESNSTKEICPLTEDESAIDTTQIVHKETLVSEQNMNQFNENISINDDRICNIQDEKQQTLDDKIAQQKLEYPLPRDVSVNETQLNQLNNIEQLKNINADTTHILNKAEERLPGKGTFDSYIIPDLKQDKQFIMSEGNVQPNMNPNYSMEETENEEHIGKSNTAEISCTEVKHSSHTSCPSPHISLASEYHTPTSNIGSPKSSESTFKTPTRKLSPKLTEKNAAYPTDTKFSPFKADEINSPGFTYTTRFMYQPSTSNVNQNPNMKGQRKNMFELDSFFNTGNAKEFTQTTDVEDEEKSDFLVSAYENYLNDSPPMMKEGTEKNMFSFSDSPEHNPGFFPFAVETGTDKKNDTPFNFNFGGTDTVKSPEENSEFKFLF